MAGPESANNAGAQTSFIPMLTLGIPGNAVMALMIGALTIHGIQPGPQIMSERPGMFWGMIASMWIGNLMLVIINLPLIGMWVQLLKVPYRFLYLAILLFCGIGVYTVSNSLGGRVAGGVLRRRSATSSRGSNASRRRLILGFVLGPLMEENLRRAMRISERRPDDLPRAADQPRLADRRARAVRAGRAAGDPQQARRGVPGIGVIGRVGLFARLRGVVAAPSAHGDAGDDLDRNSGARGRPRSPRRRGRKSMRSPPLSRTTRLPALASAIISALISSCWQEATIACVADQHLLCLAPGEVEHSGETRSSIRMMSADCSARTARNVSSSGSPGPAPTSVTLPAPAAVAWSFALRMRRNRMARVRGPDG